MVIKTPSGLLSFLYNETFDPDVNEYFHGGPDIVMTKFRLSPTEQSIVNQMGDVKDGTPQEKEAAVDRLLAVLKPHILADIYPLMW